MEIEVIWVECGGHVIRECRQRSLVQPEPLGREQRPTLSKACRRVSYGPDPIERIVNKPTQRASRDFSLDVGATTVRSIPRQTVSCHGSRKGVDVLGRGAPRSGYAHPAMEARSSTFRFRARAACARTITIACVGS